VTRNLRIWVVPALCAALALAACGGDDEAAAAKPSGFSLWDPYPQFGKGDRWPDLVDRCGAEAGVTIKRSGYETTALTNKALLAAQQGNPPDVLVVDNPNVSTLVEAGALTSTEAIGVDTSAVAGNVLDAGKVDGKTYGVPIGANTLALYYNRTVLDAAGVDPADVVDWASLDRALARVKASGKMGITFSAIGTEEGTFQFLPWFWGAGAKLTRLDSPEAAAALTLWSDWLRKGYAPPSVINNSQTSAWQEFETGDYAFAENGTWQLAGARKSGIDWGVIPIPATAGGTAPSPTGGEFVAVPVQDDARRYDTSRRVVTCLVSGDNALTTDSTLSYIAAVAALQERQVAADPDLKVWVAAVRAAKGRTGDNLGTKYPVVSAALWRAFQSVLSGGKDPQSALSAAQAAAEKGTAGG
jgi:multiple sugar transport system substrate-binding protein